VQVPLYVYQQKITGVDSKRHAAQLSNIDNNTCNLAALQLAATVQNTMQKYNAQRDVQVGHDSVHPVQSARDLGVCVDGGMTMRTHINHVLSSCYGTLRQLRSIKRSLPSHALNTLVTSLVHSRLDYCNVVFAGLPACDIQLLQSILNTAVRLVAGSS